MLSQPDPIIIRPNSAQNLLTLLEAHPQPVTVDKLNGRSISGMTRREPPYIEIKAVPKSEWHNGIIPGGTKSHYALTDEGLRIARALKAGDESIVTVQRIKQPPPPPRAAKPPLPKPTPAHANGNGNGTKHPVSTASQSTPIGSDHDCDTCPEREELALVYQLFPEIEQHIAPIMEIKRRMDNETS
jgi:hypothetical protein